nr:MAG TPA: hypothetical protein [Caudoviricetes sp.]
MNPRAGFPAYSLSRGEKIVAITRKIRDMLTIC